MLVTKVSWNVANWYTNCSCLQKIAMHQTIIMFSYSCFKVHLKFPSIMFLSIKKLSLDVPSFYLKAPSTQAWNIGPDFLVNCPKFGLGPHKICLLNVEMDVCKIDPQLLKYWLCCVEFSNSFIQLCSNIKHEMKIKLKLKGCSLLISKALDCLKTLHMVGIRFDWHVNICLKLCFTLSFSCLFLAFVIDFC